MSMSLLEKMTAVATGTVPLWLDDSKYASRLLADGSPPWSDVAAYSAWRRRSQNLLRSDVIMFSLADALHAWLAGHPATLTSLRAKRRSLYPFKTLLADQEVRKYLVELLRALRGSWPTMPLSLVCQLPGRVAAQIFRLAFDADCEMTDDDADAASVYIADLLREFGDVGVDALLLGGVTDALGEEQGDSFCQPLINVGAHYRWSVGQFVPRAGADSRLSFIVTATAVTDSTAGLLVQDGFWNSDAPAPQGGQFRFAEVPADAAPEVVLRRIEVLRQ